MKKTVEQRTVIEKKLPEIFINGKNAVSMPNIDQFKGHTGSAFHGIFVSAGRTETAMTTERNKFKLCTVRATIHGTTEGRITTVDHLIDIFHFRFSGMKSILNFFIIVGKDSL